MLLDGGEWFLAAETASYFQRILIHYRRMPELFSAAQASNDAVWRVVLRASLSVARSEAQVRRVELAADSTSDWPIWQVAIAVGGMFIVGATVGIVVGAMVAD